jgi:hypothetical protein
MTKQSFWNTVKAVALFFLFLALVCNPQSCPP